MEIDFANSKMEKTFNSEKMLQKEYGLLASAIMRRMVVLRDSLSLSMVPVLPPERRHELSGDRAGCFAVDLKHPHRLVFEPSNRPAPIKADGGYDLEAIKAIRILEVVDYH
jgi:proteic killer suppression protein